MSEDRGLDELIRGYEADGFVNAGAVQRGFSKKTRNEVPSRCTSRGARFHWHQDARYHESIEPAERLIGAWVALDDADEESGCMWMVPGSHRWGLQEHHLLGFPGTRIHGHPE